MSVDGSVPTYIHTLSLNPWSSSQYGKPGFPEDTDTYAIEDYIGPDSKLVVVRHEIFRELGVRLMTSAQADLTEFWLV